MKRLLRPLLFTDEHPEKGAELRASPVAPAQRSPSALRKVAKRKGSNDLPAQSFQTLLKDLSSLTRNRVRPKSGGPETDIDSLPTPLQAEAFRLLGVSSRL